jgi:hypothetical protein
MHVRGNRSQVDGDKRTAGIEPRSDFTDASVDQTDGRSWVRAYRNSDVWRDNGIPGRVLLSEWTRVELSEKDRERGS